MAQAGVMALKELDQKALPLSGQRQKDSGIVHFHLETVMIWSLPERPTPARCSKGPKRPIVNPRFQLESLHGHRQFRTQRGWVPKILEEDIYPRNHYLREDLPQPDAAESRIRMKVRHAPVTFLLTPRNGSILR